MKVGGNIEKGAPGTLNVGPRSVAPLPASEPSPLAMAVQQLITLLMASERFRRPIKGSHRDTQVRVVPEKEMLTSIELVTALLSEGDADVGRLP